MCGDFIHNKDSTDLSDDVKMRKRLEAFLEVLPLVEATDYDGQPSRSSLVCSPW